MFFQGNAIENYVLINVESTEETMPEEIRGYLELYVEETKTVEPIEVPMAEVQTVEQQSCFCFMSVPKSSEKEMVTMEQPVAEPEITFTHVLTLDVHVHVQIPVENGKNFSGPRNQDVLMDFDILMTMDTPEYLSPLYSLI